MLDIKKIDVIDIIYFTSINNINYERIYHCHR